MGQFAGANFFEHQGEFLSGSQLPEGNSSPMIEKIRPARRVAKKLPHYLCKGV
jgi:hypothetical protein